MVTLNVNRVYYQGRNDTFLWILVIWIAILMAWAMYSLVFDILFSIPID